MNWEHILLEKKEQVALITLNRPEKMNAFGGRMRQEIVEVLNDVADDFQVRVVLITGAGKAFCVGGDVNEFVEGSVQAISKEVSNYRHPMGQAVLAINSREKPVIAAVNGVAAGGGCNLALACDIRIASEKARFGQVFTRGAPSRLGWHLLPAPFGGLCQGRGTDLQRRGD